MNRIAVFMALVFLLGCLDLQPKPLNETGLFPMPTENSTPTANPDINIPSSGSMLCTMNLTGNQSMVLKIQGTSMRSDSFFLNKTYTTLIKGSEYYMSGGDFSPNCTWVHFTRDSFKGVNQSLGNLSFPSGLAGLPNCQPAEFTPDVFEINGTICELGEILNITR